MDEILLCDAQDRAYMGGQRNQMISPSHALRTMFSGLKGWLGDSGGLEFTDPIPNQAIRRAALSGVADPQFFFAELN